MIAVEKFREKGGWLLLKRLEERKLLKRIGRGYVAFLAACLHEGFSELFGHEAVDDEVEGRVADGHQVEEVVCHADRDVVPRISDRLGKGG